MEFVEDINKISDGRLYESNDLVRLNSDGCNGCSKCCHGMGDTITLDPLDVHRLLINLNTTFEELLSDKIELSVKEGAILPNIKMVGSTEKCGFLNEQGRCSIHEFRPGICRLFPLGRYYSNETFKYFVFVNGCHTKEKSKIKVKKWLNTENLKEYEKYIASWHYYIKNIKEIILNSFDDEYVKGINMYNLQNFYVKPYNNEENFYDQFNKRLIKAKESF